MLKYIFRNFLIYDKWVGGLKRTNIPVIKVKKGSVIKNISKLPLEFNPDMQVYMSYIHPHNFQMAEAMIMEIPINSSSKGHHHLYGEEIIVLSGSGCTRFEQNKKSQQEIEWAEGSYLFIPFNLWHQHFNTGDKPARFLVVTPAPLLINIFRNRRILYNIHYPFKKGIDDLKYIKKINTNKNFLKAYFIKDIIKIQLPQSNFIGKDYRYIQFRGNILRNILHSTHIGELNSGTYIRAHKHGGEIFIYILCGKGYILLRREDGFKEKIDLEKDDLVNEPPWQYHQIFSTGNVPLRYVAFKGVLSFTGFVSLTGIPYTRENKDIKEIFEKEITALGNRDLIDRYREWRKKIEK